MNLQQSKKKPYYRNSKFTKSGEWNSTNDWRTKTNIMMQSALRVSYTSPKVMHWITKLLIWLSEDDCKHIKNDDITKFDVVAENVAIESVKENFFSVCDDGEFWFRSNCEIKPFVNSARSASSCWVSPYWIRSSFIRCPISMTKPPDS